MQTCNVPGCPELTDKGKCETHERQRHRETNAKRPSSRQAGYDRKWELEREKYLSHFPLCAVCGAPAKDLHHVDGLGPLGPRGYDWGNLEGLCRSCHSRETGKEHGFGTT